MTTTCIHPGNFSLQGGNSVLSRHREQLTWNSYSKYSNEQSSRILHPTEKKQKNTCTLHRYDTELKNPIFQGSMGQIHAPLSFKMTFRRDETAHWFKKKKRDPPLQAHPIPSFNNFLDIYIFIYEQTLSVQFWDIVEVMKFIKSIGKWSIYTILAKKVFYGTGSMFTRTNMVNLTKKKY